jgi:sugar lactone lactonase YvrE
MTSNEILLVLDAPMQLGESPVWSPSEELLYGIDIAGMSVQQFNPDNRRHRAWGLPSEPGCMALCAEGGLVVAMRFGLGLLDTDSGELTMIADAPHDPAKNAFQRWPLRLRRPALAWHFV